MEESSARDGRLTGSGRVNVQIETVLALVTQMRQQPFQLLESSSGHSPQRLRLVGRVRQPLRAHGAEAVAQLDAVPRRQRSGRTEAVGSGGRSGVRYAQKHFDGRRGPASVGVGAGADSGSSCGPDAALLDQALHFAVARVNDARQRVGDGVVTARHQRHQQTRRQRRPDSRTTRASVTDADSRQFSPPFNDSNLASL